ncbi:hypothetical protein MHYP_G00077430 [Metynnis hypsauchen]
MLGVVRGCVHILLASQTINEAGGGGSWTSSGGSSLQPRPRPSMEQRIGSGTSFHLSPSQRTWRNCHSFHLLLVDHLQESGSTAERWTGQTSRLHPHIPSGKLVEVKLQHKAVYSGLESEHWWVLTNDFYHVRSQQLPPLYFARAIAVAYIKNIGRDISEAKVYLRTETTESSVQDDLLQTTMCRTFKEVSVDKDGRFRCHDSSDAQTLETPAPFAFSSPRRPPPGF